MYTRVAVKQPTDDPHYAESTIVYAAQLVKKIKYGQNQIKMIDYND